MKYKFFDLARKLSKKSDHEEHKLGCVIVKKNQVLGLGFNKVKTHTKSNHPHRRVHAELDAILDCDRLSLQGADIYIYREAKNGSIACAKPCKWCRELIESVDIRNIYFTDYGMFNNEKLY